MTLWLTNLGFHVAFIQHDAPMARHSLIVGIDIVLLLVTVVGGRIVPAFRPETPFHHASNASRSQRSLTLMPPANLIQSAKRWTGTAIATGMSALSARSIR